MLSKLLYTNYRNEKIKLDKKSQVTKRGVGGAPGVSPCLTYVLRYTLHFLVVLKKAGK